jgi:methionyl-tRNA formyltransferase
MKILLLFGKNPNHQALACKISEEFKIEGIVIEKRKPVKRSLKNRIKAIWDRYTFYQIYSSWLSLMSHYKQIFPEWPDAEKLSTENINDAAILRFIKNKNPDLILVSGTRILSKKFLAEVLPIAKIMNLHTGISPYVKGGPNCTNWCLANNTFHLIGNTIMWINEGIDSGNIITTERTMFEGDETLTEIHFKVMEHAHDLYLRAIRKAEKEPNLTGVNQEYIAEGKLFLSKRWSRRRKKSLLRNIENDRFGRVVQSLHHLEKANALNLIEL